MNRQPPLDHFSLWSHPFFPSFSFPSLPSPFLALSPCMPYLRIGYCLHPHHQTKTIQTFSVHSNPSHYPQSALLWSVSINVSNYQQYCICEHFFGKITDPSTVATNVWCGCGHSLSTKKAGLPTSHTMQKYAEICSARNISTMQKYVQHNAEICSARNI